MTDQKERAAALANASFQNFIDLTGHKAVVPEKEYEFLIEAGVNPNLVDKVLRL